MAYPGDTSRFGDAELADLGRQGPNDFFNGLLAPAAGKFDSASAADPTALAGSRNLFTAASVLSCISSTLSSLVSVKICWRGSSSASDRGAWLTAVGSIRAFRSVRT